MSTVHYSDNRECLRLVLIFLMPARVYSSTNTFPNHPRCELRKRGRTAIKFSRKFKTSLPQCQRRHHPSKDHSNSVIGRHSLAVKRWLGNQNSNRHWIWGTSECCIEHDWLVLAGISPILGMRIVEESIQLGHYRTMHRRDEWAAWSTLWGTHRVPCAQPKQPHRFGNPVSNHSAPQLHDSHFKHPGFQFCHAK